MDKSILNILINVLVISLAIVSWSFIIYAGIILNERHNKLHV